MKKAALPKNEPRRLATLHALGLLDTSPEARFDAITRTASAVFGTPIALISLVDEKRQWFKSRQGLEVPETPRDVSFCAHAILDDGIFVVTDSHLDERFSDNPLVTAPPNVRFYAGAPLAAPNGDRIGTLCLIDSKPRRTFTDEQRLLLQALSGWAEAEIALRAEQRAITGSVDRLLEEVSEPVIVAGEGRYIRYANRRALRVLGYGPARIYGKHITSLITEPDPARVDEDLDALLRPENAGKSLEYTASVVCGDGNLVRMPVVFLACNVAGRAITAVVMRPLAAA